MESGSRRLCDVDGWGTLVEAAGVVQLLDAVAASAASVDEVRTAIVRVAGQLEMRALTAARESAEARWDPVTHTPESWHCCGDCPRCLANRDEVQQLIEEARPSPGAAGPAGPLRRRRHRQLRAPSQLSLRRRLRSIARPWRSGLRPSRRPGLIVRERSG